MVTIRYIYLFAKTLDTIINNIIQHYAGANQWQLQYPWFSLGHLLQAASKKNTEGFQLASQKAAIYFNDVQRLHWLLHQQEIHVAEILATYDLGIETHTRNEEIFTVKFVEAAEEEQEEQEEQAINTNEEEPIMVVDNVDTALVKIFEITKTDDVALGTTEPAIRTEAAPIEELKNDSERNTTIVSEVPDADATTEPILETAVVSEIKIVQTLGAETNDTETAETIAVALNEAIEVPQIWQNESYDPDDTDGPEDKERHEPELKNVMDIAAEKFEATNISQSLAVVSKLFKEENTEDALELPIEIYHTVDYFASQGIKLVLEPRADDKFGQQLKTFTNWLKQMKKLPATKMSEKEHDSVVENIASSSLEDGEVLTESMAEVLMKQGRESQAIEVWQKLSLLYPEKSHYFAALIEKTKV